MGLDATVTREGWKGKHEEGKSMDKVLTQKISRGRKLKKE